MDEGIGSSSIDGSISGSTPSSTSSSASSSTSSSTSSGTSSSTSSNTSSGSSGGRIFQEPTANGPVSLDETYRRYVSSFPSEEKPTFFSMIQCMQKEELGIHEARCASFLLDDEDGDEGPDKDDGDGDDHDDEEEKEEHTTSFEPVNGWTNLTKNIATANTTSLPVEQPASLNLTGSFSYMELIQPASFHNTSHRHDRSLLPWVALRIKNVIGEKMKAISHTSVPGTRRLNCSCNRTKRTFPTSIRPTDNSIHDANTMLQSTPISCMILTCVCLVSIIMCAQAPPRLRSNTGSLSMSGSSAPLSPEGTCFTPTFWTLSRPRGSLKPAMLPRVRATAASPSGPSTRQRIPIFYMRASCRSGRAA